MEIGSGQYDHDGSTVQDVYWDSEVSFTIGSGGSNSGSSAAGTSQWQYLYLDDSAIVTQGVPELDADCFLNSTTAPTYNQSKHGWYNASVTNDRCIFAFYIDGSGNIAEFFHNGGDYVLNSSVLSSGNATSSWQSVTLVIPAFAIRAMCNFLVYHEPLSVSTQYWRVGGTSPTYPHVIGRTEGDEGENAFESVQVYTNSSLQIEVQPSDATRVTVETAGYFLPGGM
jgi:hypothetical protein